MQSDIVQRLQPILRRNGWGNVQEYSRHIPFMLEREGLCIVEAAEITRLTEALRAADERGLTKAWCRWMHGGGNIQRDDQDRLNWRCAKCGRWGDNPVPVRAEILAVRAELERIADE